MGKTGKTAIIVPTYNEVENIDRLIDALLGLGIPGYVVVVDDNSPDGTWRRVAERAEADERVVLVHRPRKLGLGTAYVAGIERMMVDPEVEYFMTMDADFSHHPRFIPSILEAASGADIVIGSRYVPGGRTEAFAFHRRLISRSANLFAKTLLGLTPNDCTAGFRCYRRHVLETIDLSSLVSRGYSFLVEMLYRCTQAGFQVREVPIVYVARAHGLSKISMAEIRNTGFTILRLWRERLLGGGRR